MDNVDFLLSEKFSQDPLEEHLAKQWKKGNCNENRAVEQLAQQEVFLKCDEFRFSDKFTW